MADRVLPRCRARQLRRVQLTREAYRALADFRYLIRRFLQFSQMAADRAGLPAAQHQALLAIKAFPAKAPPTVGDLAEKLRVQHHTAVELVDRLVEAGLVVRAHDPADRRRVLLALTDSAEERLAVLSVIHLQELHALRPALYEILDRTPRFETRRSGALPDRARGP